MPTTLDHAMYGNLTRMIDFLSRFSRDVFRLTHIGNVARLRELLTSDPESSKKENGGGLRRGTGALRRRSVLKASS